MERVEHALRGRGVAGRAAWAAVRVAAPAKRALWHRTRHFLLERPLDDIASPRLELPPGIHLGRLARGEEPDLSDFWPRANAQRMRRTFLRAVGDGATGLVAREEGRVVAIDFISEAGDEDVELVSPGACYGFLLAEARAARGRGIGLALAAYSFAVARERGFQAQLTHVWDGNAAMLAASTQLLGFRIVGSARRQRMVGITRWSWQVDGSRRRGRRLLL
jgi:hypothetical protein